MGGMTNHDKLTFHLFIIRLVANIILADGISNKRTYDVTLVTALFLERAS